MAAYLLAIFLRKRQTMHWSFDTLTQHMQATLFEAIRKFLLPTFMRCLKMPDSAL